MENCYEKAYIRINAEGKPDDNGIFLLFGYYPTAKVTDSNLIEALNGLIKTLPTQGDNGAWTSYKYYIFDENDVDFMWYQDVLHDDAIYRGVYFTKYRPKETMEPVASYENSCQGANGYCANTVYWFKYEQIKWNVLAEKKRKAWIIADKSVDAQPFRNVVWDNEYVNSSIRAWLNDVFLSTAFDKRERKIIVKQKIYDDTSNEKGKKYTLDCIHLLSANEASQMDKNVLPLQSVATDYAICQGISVNQQNGNSVWWLRSASGDDTNAQIVGTYDFCNFSSSDVTCTDTGVRPSLWIKL